MLSGKLNFLSNLNKDICCMNEHKSDMLKCTWALFHFCEAEGQKKGDNGGQEGGHTFPDSLCFWLDVVT